MTNDATATTATKALDFINARIAEKKTVSLASYGRITQISPRTVASFAKAGAKLFMIDSEGNLRVAAGKRFDIIATKTVCMVRISAV